MSAGAVRVVVTIHGESEPFQRDPAREVARILSASAGWIVDAANMRGDELPLTDSRGECIGSVVVTREVCQ